MKNEGSQLSQQDSDLSQVAEKAAEFLRTLANPNRLIILVRLLQGEACVGDLEKSLKISQSALSQHLSRMRGEGILARRRASQQIFYSINDEKVEKFINLVKDSFGNNN